MRKALITAVVVLSGCYAFHPARGAAAMSAVVAYQTDGIIPVCAVFKEGLDFPDGSVVDRIEGNTVIVIIPDPRSAEGEDDHLIPCR